MLTFVECYYFSGGKEDFGEGAGKSESFSEPDSNRGG